ncbi:MAG: hypothetical protein LBT73_03100 [Tannerellaceae bacterium]|jgi:hypothetical protein|nr:hypothetical protein [Tannerellaceae bacterium]
MTKKGILASVIAAGTVAIVAAYFVGRSSKVEATDDAAYRITVTTTATGDGLLKVQAGDWIDSRLAISGSTFVINSP